MKSFLVGKCGFTEIRACFEKMSISMHIFYFIIGVIKTKPPTCQGDSLKKKILFNSKQCFEFNEPTSNKKPNQATTKKTQTKTKNKTKSRWSCAGTFVLITGVVIFHFYNFNVHNVHFCLFLSYFFDTPIFHSALMYQISHGFCFFFFFSQRGLWETNQ